MFEFLLNQFKNFINPIITPKTLAISTRRASPVSLEIEKTKQTQRPGSSSSRKSKANTFKSPKKILSLKEIRKVPGKTKSVAGIASRKSKSDAIIENINKIVSPGKSSIKKDNKSLRKSKSEAKQSPVSNNLGKKKLDIFNKNNSGRKKYTIDIHELSYPESIFVLEKRINEITGICKSLVVITGRGLHSKGGVPVLYPKIQLYLQSKDIKYILDKPSIGCIKILL